MSPTWSESRCGLFMAVIGVLGSGVGLELGPLKAQCQCLAIALAYFVFDQQAETFLESEMVQVQRALFSKRARHAEQFQAGRRPQHGHEHLGAADFAGAAVGHANGLAGVIDEQPLAGCVGLPHRRRQLQAPASIVLAERAVLVLLFHGLEHRQVGRRVRSLNRIAHVLLVNRPSVSKTPSPSATMLRILVSVHVCLRAIFFLFICPVYLGLLPSEYTRIRVYIKHVKMLKTLY